MEKVHEVSRSRTNPGYAVVVQTQENTYTWASTAVYDSPELALEDLMTSCPPAQSRHFQFFLVGMAPDEALFFGYQGFFTFSSWQLLRIEDDLWVAGQDEGAKTDFRISYIED